MNKVCSCPDVWVQSVLAGKALELADNNKGLSSGIIGVGIFCGGGLGTLIGSVFLKYFNFSSLFILFTAVIVITMIFLNRKNHQYY
jgi:predicted MFS family arabinose efflux permease